MKKILAFGLFAVLVISMFSIALADSNNTNRSDDDDSDDLNESDDDDSDDLNESDDDSDDDSNKSGREEFKDQREQLKEEFKERMERLREEFKNRMREHNGSFRFEDRNITIRELSDEQKEIIAGKINAKTGLNLTAEDIGDGTAGEILRAYLSNGRWAEVKIMPDVAALIALDRLRSKCDERNCSVELKEVGIGNKTRLAYVLETEKDSRLFLVLKKKMVAVAEVDAETGEIIKVRKPWWRFLAKEKNTDDEIDSSLNETAKDKITICHKSDRRAVTITISKKALNAHLKHGDRIGACSKNQTNNTAENITLVAPPTISDLTASNMTNESIYWGWTNPTYGNFSEAMVYFNGVNVVNTTYPFYNAVGLNANTTYTIRINTRGITGLVNLTDVSANATTLA